MTRKGCVYQKARIQHVRSLYASSFSFPPYCTFVMPSAACVKQKQVEPLELPRLAINGQAFHVHFLIFFFFLLLPVESSLMLLALEFSQSRSRSELFHSRSVQIEDSHMHPMSPLMYNLNITSCAVGFCIPHPAVSTANVSTTWAKPKFIRTNPDFN